MIEPHARPPWPTMRTKRRIRRRPRRPRWRAARRGLSPETSRGPCGGGDGGDDDDGGGCRRLLMSYRLLTGLRMSLPLGMISR